MMNRKSTKPKDGFSASSYYIAQKLDPFEDSDSSGGMFDIEDKKKSDICFC